MLVRAGLAGDLRQRQHDPEHRAFAEAALDLDVAAHQLGEFAADRQPQARTPEPAGVGVIGLGELGEDFRQHVGRYAHAAVADGEA